MYIIEINLWEKFQLFHLKKKINQIWIIKFEVLCNFKLKYGLNIINIKIFTQQMGWLGCQGIEFHPRSPRIKL